MRALEIPSLNVPVAPATAVDASLRFPAAIRAQCDASPADNVAQTVPVFHPRGASRNHARPRPLPVLPARGKLVPVRAILFAPPDPFSSNAPRSFGIFFDLPVASRSIDRADCSNLEHVVAGGFSEHSALVPPPAASLGSIRSRRTKSALSLFRLPTFRIVVTQPCLF